MSETVRVAAVQTANRTIPYSLGDADAALKQVRANLDSLVGLAERAAADGCAIIAFPEDTLGTLEWEAGHWDGAGDLLRPAEAEMLTRLGGVARDRDVHIICCNDLPGTTAGGEGVVYNTAVLIGPGGEVGRYHKVQPTLGEQSRARGTGFPVFEVPGVGCVGMCICYDIMFPETTRALALAGADLVFHLTLGGASLASADASQAAFKTRAAENYIYLVVAFRSGGSMVISPKGEILAEGSGADRIITADIDPTGGRDAGDAHGGITEDFRARLFRERNPAAYGLLTAEHPPALDRLQHVPVPTAQEAADLFNEALTTGADAFYEAEEWQKAGRVEEARERLVQLSERFGTAWIGRASRERLADLPPASGEAST